MTSLTTCSSLPRLKSSFFWYRTEMVSEWFWWWGLDVMVWWRLGMKPWSFWPKFAFWPKYWPFSLKFWPLWLKFSPVWIVARSLPIAPKSSPIVVDGSGVKKSGRRCFKDEMWFLALLDQKTGFASIWPTLITISVTLPLVGVGIVVSVRKDVREVREESVREVIVRESGVFGPFWPFLVKFWSFWSFWSMFWSSWTIDLSFLILDWIVVVVLSSLSLLWWSSLLWSLLSPLSSPLLVITAWTPNWYPSPFPPTLLRFDERPGTEHCWI